MSIKICIATTCMVLLTTHHAVADDDIEVVETVQNGDERIIPLDKSNVTSLPPDRISQLAGQGNPNAQYALAKMRLSGSGGFSQNDGEAVKWLEMAVRGKHVNAMYRLAILNEQWRGVSHQDYKRAAELYTSAAYEGHTGAQVNLGLIYLEGKGLNTRYAEAHRWFEEAADAGNPKGMYYLGTMYEEGHGVSKDRIKACVWYTLAADRGHSLARGAMDRVRSKMQSLEIKNAQVKAAGWRPSKRPLEEEED